MKEEVKNQCCVACKKEHPDDEMGCRFDFDCPCHQPEPKNLSTGSGEEIMDRLEEPKNQESEGKKKIEELKEHDLDAWATKMNEREIKFRQLVKTISPSGDNSNLQTKEGGLIWHYFGLIDNAWVSPVGMQYPIMQFTGLKDKNGKDIYEGDIVLYAKRLPEDTVDIRSTQTTGTGEKYYDVISVVHFFVDDFVCGFHTLQLMPDFSPKEREVIGNIYENPELHK